jgi:hypothetical protein
VEDTIETCFETRNDFRMLAPWSVARGMLALGDGTESVIKQKEHAAAMMNLIEKMYQRLHTIKLQETEKQQM